MYASVEMVIIALYFDSKIRVLRQVCANLMRNCDLSVPIQYAVGTYIVTQIL